MLVGGVAVVGFFSSLIFLLPQRKGHEFPEHPEIIKFHTVRKQASKILKIPRFWLFFTAMFLGGGGEFCLTFWCASYIQLNLNSASWAGGVGLAFFAAGMILGRMGWGYIIRQHHLNRLIICSGIVGAMVTIFLPFIDNLWIFFVFLFFSGICAAPFWPSVQSYCADCMPEVDTTMLFILLSCAGIPGCGVLTFLMGFIGNHYGLETAFFMIPVCFVLLAIVIAVTKPNNGSFGGGKSQTLH